MCGTTPNHGFHRSQTELMPGSPSYGGNRSPIYGGGLQTSNGSSWTLQRKPSFDQGGAYGFGTSPPMEGPIVFIAPELTQETLLEVRVIKLNNLAHTRLYNLIFTEGAQRHVGQTELCPGTGRMRN